jgi:hypothetical protein
MTSLYKLCSTVVTTAGMVVAATLVSPAQAAAQQKPSIPVDLVRNVDEPGFNPYEVELNAQSSGVGFTLFFPVPTNKMAVIEHVSLTGEVPTGQVVQAFLICEVPPADAFHEAEHALVLVPQGSFNGNTWYTASQSIKCMASEGSNTLAIHMQTFPFSAGGQIWHGSVSGYLVPQ